MEWTEAETIQAVTKIKRIVILITKSMTIALDVVSTVHARCLLQWISTLYFKV